MRVLALGGAVGPALYTVLVIVCGTLRPGYNHLTQLISELGARGTAHAGLLNLAGAIPAGVLIAGFGVATHRLLSSGRRSLLASGLVAFYGVAMIVFGILPCDPGCPPPGPRTSVAATIHSSVALAACVAAIVGIGLWAREFRQMPGFRDLWAYTGLASAAGLAFLIAFVVSLDGGTLIGLWQRLLVGTLFVWCAVVALRLFRGAKGPRRRSSLGGSVPDAA
jgi:hypothetical membrane protein